HDVGRSKREPKHQKSSARLLGKVHVPLGWEWKDVQLAAIVTRYHRGRPPALDQKAFARLQVTQQARAKLLAGVLRLAVARDGDQERWVRRLKVEPGSECITIFADGYSGEARAGERVAKARFLLESVLGKPIAVKGNGPKLTLRPSSAANS